MACSSGGRRARDTHPGSWRGARALPPAVGLRRLQQRRLRRLECLAKLVTHDIAPSPQASLWLPYQPKYSRPQLLTQSPPCDCSFKGWDIALFSAGGSISKKYAPIASAAGCTVSCIHSCLHCLVRCCSGVTVRDHRLRLRLHRECACRLQLRPFCCPNRGCCGLLGWWLNAQRAFALLANATRCCHARMLSTPPPQVVDNSSAFRMVPDVPLVIPEVNPQVGRAGGWVLCARLQACVQACVRSCGRWLGALGVPLGIPRGQPQLCGCAIGTSRHGAAWCWGRQVGMQSQGRPACAL